MALVSVNEKGRGRRAESSLDERKTVRVFLVEVDALADGPEFARDVAGVPILGEVHPDDGLLVARRKVARETESRLLFEIDVEYSSVASQDGFRENPLDDDANINWTTREENVIATKDIGGLPIVNSAGDEFDPPVEERNFHGELSITRNEDAFDPNRADQFRGKVNNDVVRIGGMDFAIGQARLTQYDGQNDERNGIEFFRVSYRIESRPADVLAQDGTPLFWRRDILDQGFNQLVTDPITGDLSKQPILDDEGQEVKNPALLDGFGEKLGQGVPAVYETYTTVFDIAFADLDLPKEALP